MPLASAKLIPHDNSPVPVLHPDHPACVTPLRAGSLFSGTFAVPFQPSHHELDYRPCSPLELLLMLSVEAPVREQILALPHDDQLLMVQECVGMQCLAQMLSTFCSHLLLLCPLPANQPSAIFSASVCLTDAKRLPSTDDWSTAYLEDEECSFLIHAIQTGVVWTQSSLNRVDPIFRPLLRDKHISITNDKLVCLKPVLKDQRAIQLIIVPKPLQGRVFEAFIPHLARVTWVITRHFFACDYASSGPE
jgi:hypothetical protein